ncbi:MAG: glutamate racemase [Thermotogae bacterium]|nr:glutamate racemase [Thermotogota bacterium]HOO75699.1 glutamate racemase [Tepiditoga sp.]
MKIGFFDSGIGGLTVMKKVVGRFGNHSYFYFGDTLRVPYGSKPVDFLVDLLENILDFYEEIGIDILVAACNTTDSLVKNGYVNVENRNFKYISIIDNGVNQISKNENVLILATQNTVNSGAYRNLLIKNKIGKITEQPCPLFVPLIEEGYWYGPMAESIVKNYLYPHNSVKYDKVILGCTHYPILKKHIIKNINSKVIDPTDGVIKELYSKYNLSYQKGTPSVDFYVTGDVDNFKYLSRRFFRKNKINSNYYKTDLFSKRVYYRGG